jgi:hypothetical protein
MTRINLLPDPRFAPLALALEERMATMAAAVAGDRFAGMLDDVATRGLTHAFRLAGADEGTLWICNQEETHLIPVFNSGARPDSIVGAYRQPLSSGLISMVFLQEMAFCENNVYQNAGQDRTLDQKLQVLTCAMIAVPVKYSKRTRGVLSCVKLKPADGVANDPPPFGPEDITIIQTASTVFSRQVDRQLLGTAVGWDRLSV